MWCVMCTCRRCVCGPWPCSERKSCQLCPGAVGQPCLPEDTCIYVLGSSPHLCSLKYLTQKTSTELLAPPSRTRASKHRPVPHRACLLGAPGLVARVSTRSSHGQSRSVRHGPGPRCVHACVYLYVCVCVCWLLAGTSCWREREAKGHTAEEVATSSPLHTSRHPRPPLLGHKLAEGPSHRPPHLITCIAGSGTTYQTPLAPTSPRADACEVSTEPWPEDVRALCSTCLVSSGGCVSDALGWFPAHELAHLFMWRSHVWPHGCTLIVLASGPGLARSQAS